MFIATALAGMAPGGLPASASNIQIALGLLELWFFVKTWFLDSRDNPPSLKLRRGKANPLMHDAVRGSFLLTYYLTEPIYNRQGRPGART